MKKHYLLWSAFVGLLLAGQSASAQTLADVQCNINLEYTNVTDTVPNMYVFAYDGTANYISDGGGDMYDDGNYINTNLASEINYSDNIILASTDFGTNGAYFTRELPGFFMLAADIDSISSFSISGELGADGSGTASGYTYSQVIAGTSYDIFYKGVADAGDPSVNHYIIIPSNPNASHSFSGDTDNDQHDVNGIDGSTRLYYFLVSADPDVPFTNTEVEAISEAFLLSINGGSGIQANASATSICEGDSLTLTGSGASSYTWNNGVTDGVAFVPALGTNNYVVSAVGGNGCNVSNGISVDVIERPDFSLSATNELIGNDGSVYLTLNGGLFPFTYDWDNDGTGDFDDPQNLINVPAGTYTVVVAHGNGCTATASATVDFFVGIDGANADQITVYPNPTVDNINIDFEGDFHYNITDVAGKMVANGTSVNSTVISLANYEAGMYIVTVKNANGSKSIQVIKK